MIGMLIAVTIALALYAFCRAGALRNDLRESEQIRDALVSAVHDCRAEIARLRDESYNLRTLNEMHQQCAERRLAEIDSLRLTDAEREAVEEVIDYLQPAGQKHQNHVAAILRGLLERLK